MNQFKKQTFTLVNLGGPRTPDEIEVFLRDLFLDPFVFDLPLWEPLRKILARYIARKRAPKVRGTYASMGFGGGSPLVDETMKQARAIELRLNAKTSEKWIGHVAMACGFPNLRDHLTKDMRPSQETVHLSLFPQFSRSTVLSTASIYEKVYGNCPIGKPGWASPFGMDSRFLDLTADFILEFLKGELPVNDYIHLKDNGDISNWQELDLVFSAHGIPIRLIQKGDRYLEEINAMIGGIEDRLKTYGFRGKIHISFQSRVGRAKWTEPNTKETLALLGAEKKNIAVYPISFVGDHLETLEEIGVELRDFALGAGALSYHRIPALGVYPKFIDFLADLILESRVKNNNQICLCEFSGGERLANCRFD